MGHQGGARAGSGTESRRHAVQDAKHVNLGGLPCATHPFHSTEGVSSSIGTCRAIEIRQMWQRGPHSILHSAYCTLDTALCILHTLHTAYSAYCTLHSALCTLHSAYCTLHTAYSAYCILCILHTALCTLHTAYCILHTAYCILHSAYSYQYILHTVHGAHTMWQTYPNFFPSTIALRA